MKRLFTLIVVAMVLAGFSIGAEAGVKKIRPDQLKLWRPSYDCYQDASRVRPSGATGVAWTSVVKLPVGKKVTKLKYYHSGVAATVTEVFLYRIKMGEKKEVLALALSDDVTGANNIIHVEDTDIAYPRIKSGYTYYIQVQSSNQYGSIWGVKITYQD